VTQVPIFKSPVRKPFPGPREARSPHPLAGSRAGHRDRPVPEETLFAVKPDGWFEMARRGAAELSRSQRHGDANDRERTLRASPDLHSLTTKARSELAPAQREVEDMTLAPDSREGAPGSRLAES